MRQSILLVIAAGALAACTEVAVETSAKPTSASATASAVPAPSTPMPTGLTSDEQLIWSTLSKDAKAQAASFIANGGTLTQFVAI